MIDNRRNLATWWQREEWWLSYLIVFVISFTLFMVFQANRVLADPDSFYHAKMAILTAEQGPVRSFPWLNLTTLGRHYTDQHFLYHVILIPFVSLGQPLLGLKLATVCFGAGLITVMYWMMRQFGVRGAMVFALLTLLIRPLTFRLSLAKAPSTSLIILLIGLSWIFQYRFRRLFVLAGAYVWYYGGYPLLGVAATVYASVSVLYNRWASRVRGHHYLNKIMSLVRYHRRPAPRFGPNLKLLLIVAGGLLTGVVVNIYFPNNVFFAYQQLVNIGIINFQKVIGVGAEWYPYKIGDLIANGAIASLLVLVAMVGIVFRWRAQSKQTLTLFILTIFFFVLTLKSRRYIEYYLPLAVLFSAFSISDSLRGSPGRKLWAEAQRMVRHNIWSKVITGLLLVYFAVGLGYIVQRDIRGQIKDLAHGYQIGKLQAASEWLAANSPAGSRVVHSDWDEFPVLFYYNSHNTYIAGLDPTFLYKADPETYWTWVNITLGKFQGDIYQAVTEKLQSKYVMVAENHLPMDNLFSHQEKFKLVYTDTEAKIYAAQ